MKVDKGLSPDQLAEVQALAMKTATENLGMVMIFTIAEAIKDWLIKNNVDPGVSP